MVFRIVLWAILLCVTMSLTVDYSHLQGLNAACYPRDTCNRDRMTFPNVSCECDNLCASYNDCCLDARRHPVQRRVGLTCLPYNVYEGVYAIERCLGSWSGHPTVKQKCENDDDFIDPLLSVPTTDIHSHVTYRNRYCAECNNANPNSLSTWSPTLTCESLTPVNAKYKNITYEFIAQNIARVGNDWGVYHWNESKRGVSFYPCDVSFALPTNLATAVRRCVPDVVSSCASNWRRDRVRQQCESYMAVVFVKGLAYRNVHCLLCNFISINSIKCLPPSIDGRGTPPLSFTLLMDVNPSDGNLVGVTNSCPSGQKYDPFFKKCRALVCAIPGHVMRNGRCVRN